MGSIVVSERAVAKSVSSHGTTRFADQYRGRWTEGVSCNLAATSFETPAQRHASGPTASSGLRRTTSAGRLQRTREIRSLQSPSNAENPLPCNTSWFKTDLNSPGYATLSLKMGYSKERAHVPWAEPDKAVPLPSGGPPDHQAMHLGALSSRNDRARVQEYAARLKEQQANSVAESAVADRRLWAVQAELRTARRGAEAERQRAAATEHQMRAQLAAAAHEAGEEIVDGQRIASARGQQASRQRQRADEVMAELTRERQLATEMESEARRQAARRATSDEQRAEAEAEAEALRGQVEAGLAALQEVHGGAAAQGQEVQRRLAAAAAEVGQARQQLAAAALERLACQREVEELSARLQASESNRADVGAAAASAAAAMAPTMAAAAAEVEELRGVEVSLRGAVAALQQQLAQTREAYQAAEAGYAAAELQSTRARLESKHMAERLQEELATSLQRNQVLAAHVPAHVHSAGRVVVCRPNFAPVVGFERARTQTVLRRTASAGRLPQRAR
mmetsp:Transcript_81230/g.197214  ORF Transcript_81230/g.197214 Transcript_81230/m.197214 type:complete len:508 (-) Transcript_81230:379-1902(-)